MMENWKCEMYFFFIVTDNFNDSFQSFWYENRSNQHHSWICLIYTQACQGIPVFCKLLGLGTVLRAGDWSSYFPDKLQKETLETHILRYRIIDCPRQIKLEIEISLVPFQRCLMKRKTMKIKSPLC